MLGSTNESTANAAELQGPDSDAGIDRGRSQRSSE